MVMANWQFKLEVRLAACMPCAHRVMACNLFRICIMTLCIISQPVIHRFQFSGAYPFFATTCKELGVFVEVQNICLSYMCRISKKSW